MEHSPQANPVGNRMPSRNPESLMRNVEDAVMERIIKYLNRRVRKYRHSHFCCFMLFLLAGRQCGAA